MRKLLLFLFTSIAASITLAQVPVQTGVATSLIKGTVIDSATQIPLGYVTVVVQKVGKSEAVKSTLTDESGDFMISDLTPKQYQLTLSYIGYKTKTLPLPALGIQTTIDLDTIGLATKATQLQEVQITTTVPLVEQSIDKITYNVEVDPEVDILNSLDMLRKVPLLTVNAEDNLQINGKSNLKILLNGKHSSLFSGNTSEILKMLPANSIKKVEVITSPSSRYEAEGVGGIINIITHKKSIRGYNGSVNMRAANPETYNMGASLLLTAGKFNFSGLYSNSYSNSPNQRSTFYRLDKMQGNKLEQTAEGKSESTSQIIGSELTYDPGQFDHFVASFNINRNSSNNYQAQYVEQHNAAGEMSEAYQNLNRGDNNGQGKDINLDYQRSFSKNNQQQLSLSLNLVNTGNQNSGDFTLQPLLNYTSQESMNNYDDDLKEYNLKADYTQPLGKQTLDLGIKSTFEKSSSDYYYKDLDQETGIFQLDFSQSNSFSYRESINAAYASLNFKRSKWGLRAGLRYEGTRLKAEFRSSGTSTEQQYYNLFPNITLSRMLKESGTLNLSFSQRIQRPGLYDLNPYVDLTDPLNISYGNPELKPATSHVFQIDYNNYVKSTSFNANLFCNFTHNAIEQFTVLGEDSVARTTYGNTGRGQNYGLSISGGTSLAKKLNINLNSSAQYVKYTSMINGEQGKSAGFTYTIQSTASYQFSKGWRANGSINYNSPNVMLQGTSAGYTASNISVKKDFLKNNKASISFSIRNPFQKYRRSTSEVKGLTFYQFRESYTVTRQFNLAFNYRFGKLQ
ncbi:TonB-dependent receptor domain-containing protein [Pontibacter ruber]|uniref:TonB-dependent receptor domain-containing protein n=1 Tax=Pontibacter ruber TaxID=1343895 RepID=A0ABW5CZ13_9BACT|nr:TonB-dependent receptor [Pontibacter ruber]